MKSVVISRGAAVVQDSEARKDPVLLVQVWSAAVSPPFLAEAAQLCR
jgi:hypothetical protein